MAMMRPVWTLCLLGLFVELAACSENTGSQTMHTDVADSSIRVGGLYATQFSDGTWRISKVLAFDGETVHIRMYANRFSEQPRSLDPAQLSLGRIGEAGGFGIGHAPMAKAGFLAEKRVLVMITDVTDEELDGYRYYLEAMGNGR